LTEHQSLLDYYTKSETSSNVELDAMFETKADVSAIPTNLSQLSNDSDYITSVQVEPYQLKSGFARNSMNSVYMLNING